MVLWVFGDLRIPSANELDVLLYLVGLHLVEDDAVDVFASSQDLREGALDFAIHLAAFFGAIDETTQSARANFLLVLGFFFALRGFPCSGTK